MGRRKSCSLLPSFPPFSFSLALFLISLFFLYFSFLSRLSSRSWCMCVHPACSCMQREVSFAGPRYIYEEPPASNGFDVLGRNAYLSRARSACAHTRAWGDSSCVRARARALVRTRVHVSIPRRAIRRRWEDEEGFTHAHTSTSRTGVNYASREMSNCSPYHKIYNSARCGKHYVLSRSPFPPSRPFYLQPPGVPAVHPPLGPSSPSSRPRFSPPRGHHDSQINSRGAPQSY